MADTGDADVEDWVAAALADDAVPAFALLGLSAAAAARPAALRWGVTQPRSRPRDDAPAEAKRHSDGADGGAARRGSPTTPLSWSDGAGTGAEEACSSRSAQRKAQGDGGGGGGGGVGNGTAGGSRRSKKKKTVDELRAEENELTRVNLELKQKLKAMKICYSKLRGTNGSVKSLLKQKLIEEVESKSKHVVIKPLLEGFMLPDLNLPVEEESGSETLYCMS